MKAKVESLGKIFDIRPSRSYKLHTLTVKISNDMYKELVEVSNIEDISIGELVRKAVKEYLRQYYEGADL